MCVPRCTWDAHVMQKVPHGNLLLRVSGFAEEDQRVTLVRPALVRPACQQSKRSNAGPRCRASLNAPV